MLAFLLLSILLTLSEASIFKVPDSFKKKFNEGCSGMGCRFWYAFKPKTKGVASRNVNWPDRFQELIDATPPKDLPNLVSTKWAAVIDKHMPGFLDIASAPAAPTADKAAVSLGTLKLLQKVVQDMIKPEGSGGALTGKDDKYKNPWGSAPQSVNDINMHDINQFLVKPVTRGLSISFANMMMGQKVDKDGNYGKGSPAVGKITHFISHDWGAPFKNFVATAEKHCSKLGCDPAKTYYWVCTFANNQHGFTVPDGPVEEVSPFGIALKAKPQSVLAIQNDGPPGPKLTVNRIWCVFEMAFVLTLKYNLYWGCGSHITLLEKGAKNECGGTKSMLAAFKPKDAGTSSEDDKKMILSWIDKKQELCSNFKGLKANTPQDCLAEVFQTFAKDKAVDGTYHGPSRAEVKTGESSAMPIMSSIYLHATFTILSLFVILRYVCASPKESTVDIHYGLLEAEI